jgi:hypothetical protein
MTVIEIPDEQAAALRQKAALQGLSLEDWLARLAEGDATTPGQPLKTGYGMFAEYGPAPSTEEIEENRRDMFRNFAKDF